MIPYADTNLFTRAYLELPESSEADALLAVAKKGKAAPLPLTWLHRLENSERVSVANVFLSRAAGQTFVSHLNKPL